MKNFTLMILCAGFGSRMLNLTRITPKPLLKYKNKSSHQDLADNPKNIAKTTTTTLINRDNVFVFIDCSIEDFSQFDFNEFISTFKNLKGVFIV